MKHTRYIIIPGVSESLTDNVWGRWYLRDTESNLWDKRGDGMSLHLALQLAKAMNLVVLP